jgi:hypothetical protein
MQVGPIGTASFETTFDHEIHITSRYNLQTARVSSAVANVSGEDYLLHRFRTLNLSIIIQYN